jgi:hypothetical protein
LVALNKKNSDTLPRRSPMKNIKIPLFVVFSFAFAWLEVRQRNTKFGMLA